MPQSLAGIIAHSDTNSIAAYLPVLKMKCHAEKDPPHSPNSAPWRNLLMAITGNAKRKLAVNVVDSLWRKRLRNCTTNPLPLPNQNNQNKGHKKQSAQRNSSSSAQSSDKKVSDLSDKLGKDGKLTTAERS